MAIEAKRGCGYRKVGGLYLVCNGRGQSCGRLPLELVPCPVCGGGVRQSRGWTWIEPKKLFEHTTCFENVYNCEACPAGALEKMERAGLIWIGKQHYKTPEHFNIEANSMGISRRITAVPKDFEAGKTWVFLAHPEVIPGTDDEGEQVMLPAVFKIFMPDAIEVIVKDTYEKDDEYLEKLTKRGLTPFFVPADDPDHAANGSDE